MEEVQEITLQERVFSCSTPKDRYRLLSELSDQAKLLIELGETDAETVNEVLLIMYSTKEHQEFNTFLQWKNKGFKVKKGAKSFFVWSKPKAIQKKKDEKEEEADEEQAESKKVFRMAYLFSNAQVEPVKNDK